MTIKTWIRKLVADKFGYFVHEMKTMPVGTDYAADLKLKIKLDPKVIFDVGGNVGQTVSFYKNIYPSSSVYSFEPIPKTFEQLQKHCESIPDVASFNIAFGERKDSMKIKVVKDPTSVLNSLSNDFQDSLEQNPYSYDTVTIHVETLDEFVADHKIGNIDLLKIDTEGYEVSVLKGAEKLLASGKVSAIICEAGFMRQNTRNTYFGDINDILEKHGYALFGIYEMGHLGFKNGIHYGNLLYISKDFRESKYQNWQLGN